MASFSKTNVMVKFLHNLALFWVKNANFFGENIFKIITGTSVSGAHPTTAAFPTCVQRWRCMYVVN
jgi:hypothetical protein